MLGAAADGGLQAADAGRQRGFERRQVLAGAFDDLGELHLLVRQLLDQRGYFAAEPHQAFADAIGRVDERVALAGKLGNEAADLALVLLVGALQHANFVVHHGFQLASATERARDGVVHEADLAAYGLAERGRALLGEPVGLGEANGDLGHGRGSEAQLLRAPGEQRHQPQKRDGHDDGGDGEEGRGAARRSSQPRTGEAVPIEAMTKAAPMAPQMMLTMAANL